MMRQIRPSSSRFVTRSEVGATWHSLSYGAHYDPDNVRFGPIQAINVEHVAPGQRYDSHRHADVEIVTWVLEGTLRHEDSTGHGGDIVPGVAQRLSAGTGVHHTEANASETAPLVFVQMMLISDHEAEPQYAQAEVPIMAGRLVPTVDVAAPAELFVVRFAGGEQVDIPPAARRLVHVTRGDVRVDDSVLVPGDELRTDDSDPLTLASAGPAEALVWLIGV